MTIRLGDSSTAVVGFSRRLANRSCENAVWLQPAHHESPDAQALLSCLCESGYYMSWKAPQLVDRGSTFCQLRLSRHSTACQK